MATYELQNITYFYPERKKPAIQNINLKINEGEFILFVGPSGCGKSTLLRVMNGLIPDFYGGKIAGKILFQGKDLLHKKDKSRLGCQVGTVFQDPEDQLVLTNVEKEIAFGLENMGLPGQEMKRRVAEVIDFLNLNGIKNASIPFLSGGQKQKVVLASVLAMQPQVLLLDEPTSQLDPVSAEEFLNVVKRLNEEMGLLIVLVEQRLERCFHLADRVIAMEKGQIVYDGLPEKFAGWAVKTGNDFIPPMARFFASLGLENVPLTIKEGRKVLGELSRKSSSRLSDHKCCRLTGSKNFRLAPSENCRAAGSQNAGCAGPAGPKDSFCFIKKKKNACETPVIKTKNLWFAYKPEEEVLRGINVSFFKQEFVAILGQNGAGKSTFLKILNGLLKPQRGKVWINDREIKKLEPEDLSSHIGYLSQNPNDYLFNDTVEEEIKFTLKNLGIADDGRVDKALKLLRIEELKQKNPRDLSGGERQRVALASVLAPDPGILLLDEPLRGLDYRLKKELGELLKDLQAGGKTIVLVTHDIEFVVEHAERVVLLFDGEIAADGDKHDVLSKAIFYSGQINKLFRGYEDDVMTMEEALASVGDARYEVV